MGPLEFLDSLVEVDEAVKEREYLSGESSNVAHRPIVGVENSKDAKQPPCVNQAPGYERQKWDLGIQLSESWRSSSGNLAHLKVLNAQNVNVLGEDRERPSDTEDGERLH